MIVIIIIIIIIITIIIFKDTGNERNKLSKYIWDKKNLKSIRVLVFLCSVGRLFHNLGADKEFICLFL